MTRNARTEVSDDFGKRTFDHFRDLGCGGASLFRAIGLSAPDPAVAFCFVIHGLQQRRSSEG